MWLAVHYRRLQALMLLALSALITGCAVFAPLYDHAMLQALTHLTVNAASSSATAIQIRSLSRFTPGFDAPSYEPPSQDALANSLPKAARSWFLPRIDDSSLLVTQADLTSKSPVGELLWRDGACAHVLWTDGGCPRSSGDIAVSAADRKNFALNVGSSIEVKEQPQVQQDRRLPRMTLRVTGVYRQIPGEYWDERLLAGLSGSLDPQPPNQPFHDAWLTNQATFSGSPAPWLDPINSVTFNLDRKTVGVDQALRLGPLASTMANRAALHVDDSGASINAPHSVLADVRSGLPEISARLDEGRRQALITVPLLMIQLGLLALFVLALVLGVAVEQRRTEVALARLRGSGRKGARRLVVAELLPVVLAGVPLGVAAALGLAALARRTVLHEAAPFELGVGFWTAIAGATLLLTALTWGIAARGTRDGISALLRSIPTRVQGWALGVTDAVVVAVAGTAVLAFVTGGLQGPLALAVPALLALIVGLLLAHLLVPIAAALGRRLMMRGRYAAALAMLATARRPATRRVVAVVTVSSALLVFSTYAITVGSRNRQLAAQRENGSAMVADLTGTDISRVESALATVADGHETPVVRMAPAGEAYRTTLAVVPEAFGRVALFPDADPERVPWSRLRLATGRRLSITGQAISLLATPDRFRVSESRTNLQLEVIDAGGEQTSVDLGPIPTDRARTMSAAVPCTTGCTVVRLSIRAYPGVSYGGHVTIRGVRVTGGSTNLPGTVSDWRPGVANLNRFEPSADSSGALTLHLMNDGQDAPDLTSQWFPTALPTVIAGPGTDPAVRDVNGNGLNAANRALVSVARLPRAPGVGGAAVLVDLDLLQHWGTRVANSSRIQVWFDSESASRLALVREALQRNGVEISDVRRVSDVRRSYDTSVPAWSLQLGVLVAIVGLLIAALVLILLVASTWRRRSRDLACLGMSGVPRRGLDRIAIGEQLPIVLLAVLAGAGCGLLGASFALPTIPLFAQARPPSSLDLSAPWTSVLAVLAVDLIVMGLVAWLCGRAVVARARLSRVQEVP